MNIILTAVEPGLAAAWKRHCGDLDCISIHRGTIFDVECEAVVSPANSFGFMDGGIDALYSQHFGWGLQERLQRIIQTVHHGELLVGQADIVETEDADIPFLIAAPTMRVPMHLHDSINPYLAARGVLLLAKYDVFSSGTYEGERIADYVESIAFPGLGTGVGGVDPETCAHQMRAAIDNVLSKSTTFPASWAQAQASHQRLYTDSLRDLQYD